MGRTVHLAISLFCAAALAPACLLDAGPYPSGGVGGGTGATSTGGTGGTGGVPTVCGDGVVEGGEQCDDGNAAGGDGCTPGCVIEPGYACTGSPSVCEATCGNEVVEGPAETCDDGNTATGDGCSQGCTIEEGWECEGAGAGSCHESCGDGTHDDGEDCDVGDDVMDDGCTAGCQEEPGWDCKQPGGDDTVPSVCTPNCGDGQIVGSEECDDGNTTSDDGCGKTCLAEPGWGCVNEPSECTATCGDGIGVDMELCDDGNTAAGDGCDANCQLENNCGNGVIEPGEVCDGGADCQANCTLIDPGTTCGQAVPIPPEPANGLALINTTYNGDTSVMQPNDGDIPDPPCGPHKQQRLFTYTTGPHGSVVTLETTSGVNTFPDTVLYVYRDCLGKKNEEGCNDDINGSMNTYSRVKTGYLPPQTTLYIIVGGQDDANVGEFILQIAEQPVILLFGSTFESSLDGLQTSDILGDGDKWLHCTEAVCGNNTTLSFSDGGHAKIADTGAAGGETLQSKPLALGALTNVFAQYNYSFSPNGGGGQERFTFEHRADGSTWVEVFATITKIAGRQRHDVTAAISDPNYSFRFKYDDLGDDAGEALVDDVWVYAY